MTEQAEEQNQADVGVYAEDSAPTDFTPESVREALKGVVDPEIGIDIVNLGLIYNVDVHEKDIKVDMTLTGPGCPVGPMLQSQVYGICASQPGAGNVTVNLVWTPPWDPRSMASDEAKDVLGIW